MIFLWLPAGFILLAAAYYFSAGHPPYDQLQLYLVLSASLILIIIIQNFNRLSAKAPILFALIPVIVFFTSFSLSLPSWEERSAQYQRYTAEQQELEYRNFLNGLSTRLATEIVDAHNRQKEKDYRVTYETLRNDSSSGFSKWMDQLTKRGEVNFIEKYKLKNHVAFILVANYLKGKNEKFPNAEGSLGKAQHLITIGEGMVSYEQQN